MKKCPVMIGDYKKLNAALYILSHPGSTLKPRKSYRQCGNQMPDNATMCDKHLLKKYKLHAAMVDIDGDDVKLSSNETVYSEKDVIKALRKAENNGT